MKLRVLLHHFLIVEVSARLHGLALPFLHLPGRVLPDTPLGVATGLMRPGLRQKLGLVGSFHAYILMLGFMYLAVAVGPHASPRRRDRPLGEAGRLLGLLLGQLFFGRFQLDSGVLGLGLGPLLLFLLLVLLALLGGLFLVGSIPAGLVLLPQAGGRFFPLSVLSEFSGALGLRAKLARSRLPGLPGHFFLCEMEPPTLDPFPGRTIKVFSDRNDLLPLDMKRASQYRWTLNWHTSLLNCGCEIGRYWPGPIRMVNRRSLSLG